jgi:hypothetical protein
MTLESWEPGALEVTLLTFDMCWLTAHEPVCRLRRSSSRG